MLGKSLRSLLVLFLVSTGIFVSAQTPDYSRMSNRLADWTATNAHSLTTARIGIRLAGDFDIRAFDKDMYRKQVSLEDRTRLVINKLQSEAIEKQPGVIAWLRLLPGVDLNQMENYWADNLIFFEATSDAIVQMSLNSAIDFIDFNAELAWDEPVKMEPIDNDNTRTASPGGHEPGHDAIGAPTMWSMGYTGRGRLAMGIDTGVDPSHPALGYKWQGNFKPANQSWFDFGGTYANAQDCGSSYHGSHTMGTMVGLDPATNDTIGVAFGARWIASPGICSGNSTSARIAAFQWSMNPDGDVNTTADMPDAICNSWFDPNTTNQCNGLYMQTLDAVEAVGIAVVFSAGNSGPSNSTITLPKNINNDTTSVFCVGSTEKTAPYNISNFSSRGPSTCGGSGALLIKPEVSAPGASVRSSVSNQGYSNYSGTSMAAPHVCGAILLLKEAFPYLTGRQLKMALYMSASDLGIAGEDNDYGMGIINVPAAYNYLLNQGNVPAAYDRDAAPVAINSPVATNCDNDIDPEIVIQNDGNAALTSLTIEYRFFPSALTPFNWTGNIAPGGSATVTLPTVNLPDGNYNFEVYTSNPNGSADERPYNDCYFMDFTIQGSAIVTGDTLLACPGSATLSATNPPLGGNVHWYDASTGGNQLATGVSNVFSVGATTTYFAELIYNEAAGPLNNSIGSGGNFTNDTRFLLFDAYRPFKLKTVIVYADGAGNRNIQLRNSQGTVLDQTTVNIPNGVQLVSLDFDVPVGTDHELAINGTVDLYRNNGGVSYPYTVPGVMSITRSNAGTPLNFYYFFYDWKIEYASDCGRTPVTVTVTGAGSAAAISQSATQVDLAVSGTVNFTDNSSPAATSWFWDFGDGNTSTMQNPSHTYTAVGNYTVTFIANPGSSCSDTTTSAVEVIDNTVAIDDLQNQQLDVYPNPNDGWINIRLVQDIASPVQFSLYNALGEQVAVMDLEAGADLHATMDLSNLSSGTYFLRVQSDAIQQVRRVIKR